MSQPSDFEETTHSQEGCPLVSPRSRASLEQALASLEQTLASLSGGVACQKQSVAVLGELNTMMKRSPDYVDITEAAVDRLIVEQLLQGQAPRRKTSALDGDHR